MRILLMSLLLLLSACSGYGDNNGGTANPPEVIKDVPAFKSAKGTLDGLDWSASSALAFPNNKGFMIALAGPSEIMASCADRPKTQAHMYIRTPTRSGSFSSESTTSTGFDVFARIQDSTVGSFTVVPAKKSSAEIKSIADGILQGEVQYFSDDPAGGQVEGGFQAKMCTASEHFSRMPKVWQAVGTIENIDNSTIENQEMELTLTVAKSSTIDTDIFTMSLVNLQTQKTLMTLNDVLLDDSGFWQICNGQRVRIGNATPLNFQYQILSPVKSNCDPLDASVVISFTSGATLRLVARLTNSNGKFKFTAERMQPKLNP